MALERLMASRAKPSQMTVLEDTSLDRLAAAQISRLLVLAPPWALTAGTVLAAAVLHRAWPGALAAGGEGAAGGALSVLTWHVSRQRGLLGRWHAAASVAAAAGWLAAATAEGLAAPLPYLAVVGGSALALSWNIRSVIRMRPADEHDGDHLARAFARAAEDTGMKGSRLRIRGRTPAVVEGTLVLNPGDTAEDAIKKAPRLESALKFPPGSLQIAPDLDRADQAVARITDPRAIRTPRPWPGPSRPGASIAEPVEPGVWQDSTTVSYAMAGHHLMIMGMTGAAKSTGAGYSLLGEQVTRRDEAVIAIDITKGDQTLGAWRPALHLLETDKDRARALLARVHALIKPRTDYLAARGLQDWREGCGLTHLTVWLEEAPDVFEALGEKGLKQFLSALKAARSAGVRFVISLQRADWTQMPTIARGQLAKLCMGVEGDDDASFGLSELQKERGCRPELWGSKQPGMAYIDAPGIPDDRVSMPWRTWYWGGDDKAARGHAAAWPASARPLDPLTAGLLFGAAAAAVRAEPDEDEDPVREYLADGDEGEVEDVDTSGDEIEAPDPGTEFGGWTFGAEPGEKVAPEKAREMFRALVAGWRAEGRASFSMGDVAEAGLRERTGMSRPWVYKVLDEMAEGGLIERDEEAAGRWLVLARDMRAGPGVDSPASAV